MNNEQFITLIIAKLKTLREKTKKENATAHLALPAHESEDKSLIKNLTLATDRQLELLKKLITTYRDAIKEYQQVVQAKYPIASMRDTLIKRHIVYPPVMEILDEKIKQSVEDQNDVLLEQFVKQNYLIDNDDRKMINIYIQHAKAANISHKEIATLTTNADQLAKDLQVLTKKAEYVKIISSLMRDIDVAKRSYDAAVQIVNRTSSEDERYEELTKTRQLAKQLIDLIERLQSTITGAEQLAPINTQNTADADRIINQTKSYLRVNYNNPDILLENIPYTNDEEVQRRDQALAYLNELKKQPNDFGLNENSEILSVMHVQDGYALIVGDNQLYGNFVSIKFSEEVFKQFAKLQDHNTRDEVLEILGEFEMEPKTPMHTKSLSNSRDDRTAVKPTQGLKMADQTTMAADFVKSNSAMAKSIRLSLTDQRHIHQLGDFNAESLLQKYKELIRDIKIDYQGNAGALEFINQQANAHLTLLKATVFKKNNPDEVCKIDSIINDIDKMKRHPLNTNDYVARLKALQLDLSNRKKTSIEGKFEYIHMQEQKLAKDSTQTSVWQAATPRQQTNLNRNIK